MMEEQQMSYGLLVRPRGLDETNSPYDWYKKMRKNSPVSFDPERNCWDIFCYEDVQMVLQNYKQFSSKRNGSVSTLLDLDPPTHRRYRNIVSQAFTPRAIQELAPRIQALTHELLASLQGKSKIDIVADIAYPLPVIVISEMLGVPSQHRDIFKKWSNIFVSGTRTLSPNVMNKLFAKQGKAILDLQTYFQQIIAKRRFDPKNDIVSTLITAEVDGEKLSIEELLSFCFLLLVAGIETTTNLITNTMLTLFGHPDILKQLYRDNSLIPAAIEEALRYRSPVHSMNRFVTEDMNLKGMELKKGQEVMAWIGSANRDENVFDNPDVFDINRSPNNYLSFGTGVHFCLGSQLAKLEAKICITEMLKALPDMKLDTTKKLSMIPSAFVYGFKELPVSVGLE
ncbi:cytochrome P450 [Neobacillus ginsengisoli]|uniref:Cytochrome P450 n=1 Tax=Neobacillus ginsengisoli TaxID=904295 RepID=A0ABT9Y0U4_9BACI|nr:cytochrome P450 [Neobacillus ginsengisoli]MDQ0201135.1 cytochrome P450 [Neobacillus ginsengisoli]